MSKAGVIWRIHLHLAAFAQLGVLTRIVIGNLFGGSCSGKGRWNWAPCVTGSGLMVTGDTLFYDFPANVFGSFLIGLFSTGSNLAAIHPRECAKSNPSELQLLFLSRESKLQRHGELHLGLRTGYCGSLTTFSSWLLQVVVLMVGRSMPPGMLRGTHWVQGLWAIYLGISGPLLALVLGQHAALAAAAFWTTADQVPSRLQETKMSGRPEPVPELADSAMESSAAMGTEAVETAAAAAPVGVGGGPAATPSSATPTPPSLPAAIVLEMMDRELRPVPAATQPYVTATSTTITAANGSTSGGGPRPSPPSSLPSRLRSSAALVLRPDVLVDLAAAASLLTLTGVSLAYVYLDRESAAASRGYRRYWWFSILLGPSGCFLRWYLSHLNGWRDGWLQYGTFAANVLGCALVFACEALLFRLEGSLGEVQRMALQGLMVGTAGCLTTVSTYVVEIQKLALSSLPAAYKYFLTSTLVPVALGLLVYGVPVWLGTQ